MSRKLLIFIYVISNILLLLGCTPKNQVSKIVNLAIWNNYLSPELQKKFTEQTGIEIRISNYSSNEELLAKLQSGAGGVDVAVPSDYMIEIMRKTNLLSELNQGAVPNKVNVDPKWLNRSYDPGNKYSFPYAWTSTGIAYNKELIKTHPQSWKDFFTNPAYSGKISVLDDVREVTGAVLKMNGKSLNSINADDLKDAEKVLQSAKSRIKMFRSDIIDALLNKEVAIAQAYSSDALQAIAKSPNQIDFVLPAEGGIIAIDNLVIPKSATHLDAAHALINFMLSPEVNVAFVSKIKGGPILKTTKEKLSPELKNSNVLYPSESQLSKMEQLKDIGNATQLYDELWTRIKTQ
jgi:spermidine/putrescine transport system substrate-binding protein